APVRCVAPRAAGHALAGDARTPTPRARRARPRPPPRLGARRPTARARTAGLAPRAKDAAQAAHNRGSGQARRDGAGNGLAGSYDRRVTESLQVEDVRSARPYFLAASPFKSFVRRVASIAMLGTIDIGGLVIGLYCALAVRALVLDPKPILWGLLWNHETDWLPFLILLLVLVFWRAGLYAPRELREGAGRVVPSVFLVSALALAFAIGTGQHFTTFGLYVVGALFVAALIGLFRASYELLTGSILKAVGVRRKAVLVGDGEAREKLRESLGASRGGIYYEFA